MTRAFWIVPRSWAASYSARTKTSWRKRLDGTRSGQSFGGVIYAHQLAITIGRAIQDLEILAQAGTVEDFANRVEYLPL
jgi:hypothetical protein